ncbi:MULTISPECIES: hypothetical protein [unclassified Streptomyces]|uniref:hypothetical protein n=1 Tax=unclassified Streptomyces TaxID=2593676 RepID=UPI00225190B8|nr:MULTISPECIES: hypothetical protein [unclassified Streptomyces]MCX5441468.1 hypothetical protein [Streptomyces sp. NBC_00063]WSE18714.1 hypothetical protein OG518_38375 [Streptomyces sp. NBC_01397]WUB92239.1 hypothetical protein OHO83_07775 [Streptomyces sp. NBC_00569]
MRLYAQTPARRTRQILADLIAAALIYAAVKLALVVHDAIGRLAEPGRKAESAGNSLSGGLHDAGEAASKVPFVGGQLKKQLGSAAGAGTGLADAGRSLQDTVGHVATLTTVVLIVIPVVFVLLLWLPPRLRWIRRSAVTQRLAAGPGGADLLALRVLTGSQRALAAVPTPPGGLAEAWRRGDEQVIADLAAIGMRQAGLRA